jgi:SAM-dependent methyltransferase
MSSIERRQLLEKFLEAYWLRPENALWMALRSEALSAYRFDPTCADFCCGDGLFSFLHHGGVLDPDFDVFEAVRDVRPGDSESVDMFDHVTDDYQPKVLCPAARILDVGTDIKETMLAKAARLKLFGKLVRHDHNRPAPFPAGSFRTIYCNAAYWMTEVHAFLTDLRRLLMPVGRAVLHVKLDAMRRAGLEDYRGVLGDRFVEIIMGRRLESWPSLAGRGEWESRFARAGLQVADARPIACIGHAQIWNVGLRPIAPLLIRMANALTPETRAAIKRDWVALMLNLAEPLFNPALNLGGQGAEPVEMQYVLSPP